MTKLASLLSGGSTGNVNESNTGDARDNASTPAAGTAESSTSSDENHAVDEGGARIQTTNNDFDQSTEIEQPGNREPKLIATCAPIQRMKIGKFQFDRAVLNLFEQDEVDEFRALMSKLPPADRNQIKVIDKEAAKNLVRPIEPGMTKQFDSSVGRGKQTTATGDSLVGKDPLDANVGGQGEKFAKVAQMDNNAPVSGTEPKHVVNQANQGDVDKTAEERADSDKQG